MRRTVHVHLHPRATRDAGWQEGKHPRADDGKFGSGSGKPAPKAVTREERRAWAVKKARSLAKGGKLKADDVFGPGRWIELPEDVEMSTGKEQRIVDTAALYTTQGETKLAGVEAYIAKNASQDHLPEAVLLRGGGVLILDGNHRAAAQKLQRFVQMRVNIVGRQEGAQ